MYLCIYMNCLINFLNEILYECRYSFVYMNVYINIFEFQKEFLIVREMKFISVCGLAGNMAGEN